MISQATNPGDAARSRSPFWAILIVFVTLIFLQASYLAGDFSRRRQIQATREQLKPALTRVQTLNQTTEAVGRELVVLSSQSAEAAKIVAEFKIQINNPGTRAE